MTQEPFDQYSTGTHPTGAPAPQGGTGEVAKQEARAVGHDATEGAAAVAETAKAEIKDVTGEAKAQAVSLVSQLRSDVTGQARDQQQRAAGGLHSLAGELDQMARQSDGSGMASGLVQQVSGQLESAAGWLEGREPADLLDDVRRYARRNPGTFLGICALAGFLGGRLTRGLRDDAADQQQAYAPGRATYQPVAGGYAAGGEQAAYGTETYPTETFAAPGQDTAYPTTEVDPALEDARGVGYDDTEPVLADDADLLPGTTSGSDEDRFWDEDGERR